MTVKKKRRWIKWAVLLLAIAAGALLYMNMKEAESAQYTPVEVTSGDMTVYYNFDGLVNAPKTQTVSAEAGGTVKNIYAAQNAQVKKGDRLFKLDGGETVKADMDGEITSLTIEEGSVVSVGQTIATITDMSRLNVEVEIDEYDIAAAQAGAEVEVRVLATDQVVMGRIASVDKNGTASGDLSYYTATVELGEMPEGMYPGMQVSAKILKAQAVGAVLLRADAIQFDAQNQPYVIMSAGEEGETKAVPIVVGMSDGVNCEILEGVMPGDTVLRPVTFGMPMMMMHIGE